MSKTLSAFNRTSMESKPNRIKLNAKVTTEAFNRTSMESKLSMWIVLCIVLTSFNRTSMESKQHLSTPTSKRSTSF